MTNLIERLRVTPTVTLAQAGASIALSNSIRLMMVERAEAADRIAALSDALDDAELTMIALRNHARESNWDEIDEEFPHESRSSMEAWLMLDRALANIRALKADPLALLQKANE